MNLAEVFRFHLQNIALNIFRRAREIQDKTQDRQVLTQKKQKNPLLLSFFLFQKQNFKTKTIQTSIFVNFKHINTMFRISGSNSRIQDPDQAPDQFDPDQYGSEPHCTHTNSFLSYPLLCIKTVTSNVFPPQI